jgi:hypothetical protein
VLASVGDGVDGVGVPGPHSGLGLRTTTTHGSTRTTRRPRWRIPILKNLKAIDVATAMWE